MYITNIYSILCETALLSLSLLHTHSTLSYLMHEGVDYALVTEMPLPVCLAL